MTLSVDLFWSFRSPYSYLATGRIVGFARDWDLDVNVRPVYPIAIRTPEFFADINPQWVAYLLRDVQRVAEFHGIPIAWPSPDPVVMNMATREIPADQPYIHRLTFLGIDAARAGRGLAFIDEVSRLIWGAGVKGWDEGEHLAQAAARAGLDLAEMEARIAADEAGYRAAVEANQKAHEQAGHWGVPTLVVDGEPFFGQDRLDLCLWRLKQKGLRPR